jgi:hypothetical protein
MRFFEFTDSDTGLDKFVMILKNFQGRAASKKTPAKLNWNSLQQIAKDSGFEFAADYETFKSIYDANPIVQGIVKNFNDNGIELNVPGAEEPGDATEPVPGGGKDSEEVVGKIADANAAQQLAQNQAGIKV